jgi:energy-coupling factor transport system substrate-specific component
MLKVPPPHQLAITAACVALNLAVGKIASLLSLPLPLPLDTVGSLTGAALLPPALAIAVGAVTAVLGWAVISPVYPYYIGTQISVVIAALAVMRFIGFDRLWKTVILGASVAVVAAMVSAPVTVLVFGGVTVPAMTAIDAVPIGSGQNIWSAAIIGGLPIDVADKLVVALVAWALVRMRLRSGA